MPRRPRNLPRIALVAILLVALAVLAAPASAAGFAAPDWTLPTPDGGQVSLHEKLAEGPVVVSFWATWCIPCLKEMPRLNELAGEFAGRVSFIAVSVDNSKSMAKVGPLVRAKGWDDLTIAQDAGGTVQQLLQVVSPPFVVVYDGAGSVVYQHEGYKDGDEVELRHAVERALQAGAAAAEAGPAPGGLAWRDAITARDQFEYSYSFETEREIVENWLDVAYQFGDFRTGVLLNHQSPSEEGNRRNEVVHRFFEYGTGRFDLRVGHFYGMFGRGLVWNSYEDRFIRIDTALDGLLARGTFGAATLQVMSGTTGTTPTVSDTAGTIATSVDVRGVDVEYKPAPWAMVGAAGLTYLPDMLADNGDTLREWVGSGRLGLNTAHASAYVEYGKKSGYEYDLATADRDEGYAFYANVAAFGGPLTVSLERSDYQRFAVLTRVDGKQPLNRPPALVREHIYTLLGRKPHNLNPDGEKGWQIEANADLGRGWTALGNVSRIENRNRETLFEEAYAHVEQARVGQFRVRGGLGYQDSEGAIRQTAVGDATWYQSDLMAWTLQAEHQHVRLGVLGEYDQEWFKLELELPPRWTIDGIIEVNNKYDAQFDPSEIKGDTFPSAQITYTLAGGGNLNLWFGKRQWGQLCVGGVCKTEPAFEGVEFYGAFRY
ncbi:MAG TPA: DUF6029 family protein [Candidatus Krumholzibacteria bacterium]|nr:DUF6029 family protein [Candidatus Krumholzibacteria bacterium]HPD72465.1 DUF6029 family protein [Candidatus Krumholzibacteria bacterium]HRY40603.1 DUF6029 family protein [Candidatus Krumholzibacteria bacterium]